MTIVNIHRTRRTRTPRQSGFTLIELAIVITIIGFFMVGLVKAYELYQVDKIQREQDNRMDEMRAALSRYIQDEQCVVPPGHPAHSGTTSQPEEKPESDCTSDPSTMHLANESEGGDDAVRFPCPADPGAAPGDANYATEVDNSGGACDTSGTAIDTITDSGTTVGYRGAFPARSTGLSASVMIDPYGNKYSYVVSSDVVAEGALLDNNPTGNIRVDDGSGATPLPRARFALFSHGTNGGGAFTREGNPTGIAATGDEAENTDDNNIFATRQSKFMAEGSGSYYDDTFAASLVDEDDDGWWHAREGNAKDITHRNPGNILIDPSNTGHKCRDRYG